MDLGSTPLFDELALPNVDTLIVRITSVSADQPSCYTPMQQQQEVLFQIFSVVSAPKLGILGGLN